ncbi:hypothetical protein EC973_001394 [Apophysomyces ossiformis]|uniref:Uncharacterized protein n=1 Tax=Apophysomyces ossiformis TaxID=679940 RepID=A0A8H7EN83_9FUNG|nr:hypothetical protein EC973_001394 [Apophysomyces ossiformis]
MARRARDTAATITDKFYNYAVSNTEDVLGRGQAQDMSGSSEQRQTLQTVNQEDTNTETKLRNIIFCAEQTVGNKNFKVHILDLTIPAVRRYINTDLTESEKLLVSEKTMYKRATLSSICASSIEKFKNAPLSYTGFRREFLRDQIEDVSSFDPAIHDDWDSLRYIVQHFLRIIESPDNPLKRTTRERTAASLTTIPLLNTIFMQYTDVVALKWIEVSNDDTDAIKSDGLATANGDAQLGVLVVELAGGVNTCGAAKLESDTIKIYNTCAKVLNQMSSLCRKDMSARIFVVLYHNNVLFFESLSLAFDQIYIRRRHLEIKCPTTVGELKEFCSSFQDLVSWRDEVVSQARRLKDLSSWDKSFSSEGDHIDITDLQN